MRDKNLAQHSFSALSDTTRLKIFLKIVELSASASLGDNPIVAQNTAKHLAAIFGLAKSTVAHHVEILIAADLVLALAKNRFTYLFPNYAVIKNFITFLDTQIMSYQKDGEYIIAAELYLKNHINNLDQFCDYLSIYNCKSIQLTQDANTNPKIYFKITGFNEPFFILLTALKLEIYTIKKNFNKAQKALSEITSAISNLY